MIRKRRQATDSDNESIIDMTPMLDIVFILLIFFIVTTSFVKETGIEVNRPHAETAKNQQRANILVAISASGELWIDQQQTDLSAIRMHIERLHLENPEGSLVIVADQQATAGLLTQVIDQARLAGVTNVSIAASQGQK